MGGIKSQDGSGLPGRESWRGRWVEGRWRTRTETGGRRPRSCAAESAGRWGRVGREPAACTGVGWALGLKRCAAGLGHCPASVPCGSGGHGCAKGNRPPRRLPAPTTKLAPVRAGLGKCSWTLRFTSTSGEGRKECSFSWLSFHLLGE